MNASIWDRHVGDGLQQNGGQVVVLPLNLIASIVSYLDDPGDLARVCRTCRVLHYMTLPQLHQNVTLHSYPTIRYVDGVPEGCGAASPFSMGLNGLVTRNVAGLVRAFRLWGEWREHDVEEHARFGRVPEKSMMLNIVVRAAVDKMDRLESFSWELSTKMHETLYQGLALRPALRALTIKFPALRIARPTTLIPPMPHLQALKVTDIDPLCYPDDISLLLLGSPQLRHLKLHWSPRMRDQLEPSVNLLAYFGKCIAASYIVPLETVGFQNLYAAPTEDFHRIFDPARLQAITFIDSVGGTGRPETAFLDRSWDMKAPRAIPSLRSSRGNKISRSHADFLERTSGLEELYLINRRSAPPAPPPPVTTGGGSQPNGHHPDSLTPLPSPFSGPPTPSPGTSQPPRLGRAYIDALGRSHGRTLRRLLLSDQWPLTPDELALLVRTCPKLEQLGVSVAWSLMNLFALLLPFLPQLKALRILNELEPAQMQEVDDAVGGNTEGKWGGCDPSGFDHTALRYVGVGERVFEIDGRSMQLRWVDSAVVREWEIWKMDSLEL